PNVSALNSPANNSNLSGSIVEFNFTSYDNLDNILNYTLYLDNYANSTGLTLGNNTTTNFSVNDFQEGTFHNWTIQVTDNVGNTANYSGMFFFYMNTTYSNQPPTSNIISPDNDGWISDSTPELSFILTDDLDIYINYTLFINDIANYSNSTANATPTYLNLSSLGEGSNTIIVEALDSSNERINSSILTLNIDTIPPSSTLHYPINDTWTNDDTIQFNFTLMDNLDSELDYTLYLDNSPVSYGSAQNNSIKLVNYTLPDEGFYLIKVEARDQANNTFNSTETLVVMDGNDPSSTISSPSDNSWITDATPEIIFILTDDFDPVLNYTVFVNNVSTEFGSALNNTPTSTNLTLSEGTFNIIIEARDNANARQNSTPITIFIDNNTPSSTINTPSNLTWISDITPEISFTLTDSMDSIINYSVFVDGSINSIGSANNNTPTYINLSTVTEAQHTLYVEARDEADQTFNSSVIIITTDVSAPAVSSLNSPANNTNISSSVIFNFTSYDNLDSILDYTLYLNSTINETGSTAGNDTTTSFTVSGFETFGAIYYWTIEVRDNASNAANYSGVHYFEVYDAPPNTAPNITEINDSDNDGNIEISWTADPNADYYRIYRSLSSITDATSLTALATTTALAYEDNTTIHDNTYWYAVTSLDSALNENKSVVSASYNATANDTILPRLPASFDATNLSDGSIALSWSQVLFDVNDNADTNITYRIYRGINITGLFNVSNLSYITSTALFNYTDTNITTDYNYTYAVTSLDDAGNENTSIDSTYQDITATPCVNGWSDWSDWGACSGGTQYRTRTRTCYGGGLTSEEESQSCDTGDDDGGRGGRSGGPGPSISLPSAIHEWTLLNPGAEISMKINNSQIGIINIFFSVSNQVNDGKLTVQRLSGKPAAVSHEISGKVYQYLKIDQENLENSVTSSFRIRFKVEKGWLEENGVNSNNLVLKKYSEEWNDLPTNKLNSDSDYVYYEAITSGFSYFAIAEKSQVTTSTEVAATSTTSTTTTLTETVTLSTTTTTTPKRAEFLHFLLGYISQKLNIIFITLALMLVTMISSYIFIVQKKRYDLEQEDFDMLKAHMETQDRLEKIREKLENIDKEK
ncbi:PGF-pre-PGF domain-containing protein, partial [Candidatus Woesearchaeota archaeon]|nr:PGF-pre-PGF domain-containing protein [Candidatus Woesearchaeota archaeon]